MIVDEVELELLSGATGEVEPVLPVGVGEVEPELLPVP